MLCLEEEQDIVYREAGAPVPPPHVRPWPDSADGTAVHDIAPDPRMLFRFSALTFNAHRIHYDRDYAMNEEGYPGLVVHGPLTAVLLLRLAEAEERAERGGDARPVTAFTFRGVAPLFDTAPFRLRCTLAGVAASLEAVGPDGNIALYAEAEFG